VTRKVPAENKVCLSLVTHHYVTALYQRCFEYVERWQWSWETERVETGHWFFASEPDDAI